VRFDAGWVQHDGQERQSERLLELDEPGGWEVVKVDDP
jgi:hypothetical protein